jgi:hypothetical protein
MSPSQNDFCETQNIGSFAIKVISAAKQYGAASTYNHEIKPATRARWWVLLIGRRQAGNIIRMRFDSSNFRLNVTNRRDARFGYAITRTDKPNWVEISLDTFETEDAAYQAGVTALTQHQKLT